MRPRARQISGVFALSALLAGQAGAQARGFEPADYYDIVNVSEVAVAPLGDLVAFTVTQMIEDENRRHREIWVRPLQNGRPSGEAFRFSDPTEESTAPAWSPDGSLLSFQSKRGDDDNSSWFVRVTGPGGEAFHIPGVSGRPVWSGDGQWIAYLDTPGDDESPDREGWVSPNAISSTLDIFREDEYLARSARAARGLSDKPERLC